MPRLSVPSLIVAAAIVAAASLLPGRAQAIGIGTAAAIDAAAAEFDATQQVRTVCRWRYGRRVCWWVPPVRVYRPYRYYRPHRYYRPYRPYRYYRRW
jgi:hypothetical protein